MKKLVLAVAFVACVFLIGTTFDDIDTSSPLGTQPGSVLDDEIRQLKTDVTGGMDVEHYLTGEHKIAGGPTASRPSGKTYQIYVDTDEMGLYYYDGSAWTLLGTKARSRLDTTFSVGVGATVDTDIQTLSSGYKVHYSLSCYIEPAAGPPPDVHYDDAGAGSDVNCYIFRDTAAASITDKVRVTNNSGTTYTVAVEVLEIYP